MASRSHLEVLVDELKSLSKKSSAYVDQGTMKIVIEMAEARLRAENYYKEVVKTGPFKY